MRKNLQAARKATGMTQQAMAEKLGISTRHYQRIENGASSGAYEIWDELEDLFKIHQRKLREISTIHHGQEANRLKHQKD